MNKKITLLLFLSLHHLEAQTQEFLYPVDTIIHDNQEKMCVLYQRGTQLELWLWDPRDHSAVKGLLSSFMPTGLKVLPDKKGFSFIDNDRLRLKYVEKRSPRSVDLFGPYDLTLIQWIDSHTFYFAARERQSSNLFHANVDGDIVKITRSNYDEYLYPQKIDDTLFCIKQTQNGIFSIISMPYPSIVSQTLEDDSGVPLCLEQTELINVGPFTIAFLTMHSKTLGFYIEHPNQVDKDDRVLALAYYMIYQNQDGWQSRKLFTFYLPLHLVLSQRGQARLYESILPLLPIYYAQPQPTIYFLDTDSEDEEMNVFSYDLASGLVSQKTTTRLEGHMFFTPRLIDGKFICGGSVMNNTQSLPAITIDAQGTQYFEFFELN